MTGLDRILTPKTRPMQEAHALVASLDIGSSKIACMIARLRPSPPNEALRGRSHAVELIGYSQIHPRRQGRLRGRPRRMRRRRAPLPWRWPNAWPRSASNPFCCRVSRRPACMATREAAADIRGGSVTSDDISPRHLAGMRHAPARAAPCCSVAGGTRSTASRHPRPQGHGGAAVRRRQ